MFLRQLNAPVVTDYERPDSARVKQNLLIAGNPGLLCDGTLSAPHAAGSPAEYPTVPDDLSTRERVSVFLTQVLGARAGSDAAAALVPWVCDVLPSKHSRRAYGSDLSHFVQHMAEQGLHPLDVSGDDVRLYKEAMQQAGRSAATINRVLSVIRGTYQRFGTKGLVGWERVRDIQAVKSPRVDKNTTPALSEQEARRLLHAPDTRTTIGLRDYAMLFTFFVTACRCSALANAKVGDLERTDTNWYLVVTEKGRKRQRKALLQAAAAVLSYVDAAGIGGDLHGPLFRPTERDRKTFQRKHLAPRTILHSVKKYGLQVGVDVDRVGRRGIGVHSLRKTALTNALEHGAKIEQVQQLAGHADIRTTQLYYCQKETDSEDAARHIQIR